MNWQRKRAGAGLQARHAAKLWRYVAKKTMRAAFFLVLLFIAMPAFGEDQPSESVIQDKAGTLEARLNMKFTQSECKIPNPYATPEIDISRSNYKFHVKITAGLNCAAIAGDPTIRISNTGITLGIKSIYSDDLIALCDCGIVMLYDFDLAILKETIASGYGIQKLFFVMDEAVVSIADIPNENDKFSE